MSVTDHASLEAGIDKGEPSRLLIEIALRPAFAAEPRPACDPGEVHRAIREGFREALKQVELERLVTATKPRKSRARRWFSRAVAFMAFAVLGSVTTLLLSASHPTPRYVVGSMAPSDQAAPSIETPSPGSQSTVAPAPSSAAPAAAPTGPAAFGLHEQ